MSASEIATDVPETTHYDPAWDDPLPHDLSPTRFYLSRLRKGHTKAVAIFVHGRDDNIDDMVGVFLPVLAKRYGGRDSRIDDDEEEEGREKERDCKIAIIGIEARDNSWYPESHNCTLDHQVANNAPYQYSALNKIRQSILLACETASLQPEKVTLVGFSQGANLANTYLKAGLNDLHRNGNQQSSVPLPGHILALAGSLFKATPNFPIRKYASEEHQKEVFTEEDNLDQRLVALQRPVKIVDRLICGTGDRFFRQAEIETAASDLVEETQKVKDIIDVQISVGMEPRAPHMITNRMLAATIEAIDAALTNE